MNNDDQHVPGILAQQERACEGCGRKFVIPRMDLWAYKLISKGHTLWFCRYNCARAAERKLEAKKAGRMIMMKSKKPSKNALETDLRSGLPIANIAKIYEASTQSVKIWIKSYGLSYLEGIKKSEEGKSESTPLSGRSRAPMTSGVAVTTQEEPPVIQHASPVDDMVQASPTLTEIEQCHTNAPVQEFPKVEMCQTPWVDLAKVGDLLIPHGALPTENDPATNESETAKDAIPESVYSPDPVPARDPRETFEEIWQDVLEDLAALKRCYVTLANKEFKDKLLEMVTYLAG